MPELVGDRYRLLGAIGQGGMGTVWLGHDERLDRQVAIKQVGLLPGESVADSARALREARSSAGLNHRNVVTVYDVVEDGDHIWLVMEHVPGRSMSQMIKQDGPLDPAVVAEIGAQVADGLATAHAAGTTHRDVKPGNVLVREDGVALISDFGIARNTADPALTMSGLLTGTPSYFSPQLARGADPTPGDDVWALGATLWAGVEGHSPYAARTNPVAVLHEIASSDPEPPVHAAFLAPVLQRMMDRDPASRWSMVDAAHVLRRLADEHRGADTLSQTRPVAPVPTPAPAPGPEPDPPTTQASRPDPPPRTNRRRRRPGLLAVGVLALVVLAAVIGLLAALSPGSGRQDPGAGPSSPSSSSPSRPRSSSPSSSGSTSPSISPSGSSTTSSSSGTSPQVQLVRDYYAAAPGGSDEAWAMLGPGEKRQGRAAYDRFWRGVRSVEVRSARAVPGSDVVEVTLVYRTTDGRTSTERKRETLVEKPGGGYLLDRDVPAS